MSSLNGSGFDGIVSMAQRNPEGLLLLVAGAALLMRGRTGRAMHRARPAVASYGSDFERDEPQQSSGMVDKAAAYATDVASQSAKSVQDAANYTSRIMHDTRDSAGAMAEQVGTTVRSSVDRMVNEQPLSLALLGLAAGAVAASAIPRTSIERDAMRPVGRGLGETLSEAGSKLVRSAERAGERVLEAANEHGLTTDAVRATAKDVAGEFQREFTGERAEGTPETEQVSSGFPEPGRGPNTLGSGQI